MVYPLHTARLALRPFTARDLPDFAALHATPQTMRDYGILLSAPQSRAKLTSYVEGARRNGIGRLHVSDGEGFIGYVGVNRTGDSDHPLGPHHEIGWRLLPRVWGMGYATEAAAAALVDAFAQLTAPRILAYTAPDNASSRAVMNRLNLNRHPKLDFDLVDPLIGPWAGQVWVAEAPDWAGGIE